MLNRFNLLSLLYIAILILLQVFVFNNFNFFGAYNPLVYIIYILFYPLNRNKNILLIYSFILGLGIDLFAGTPGVNAFACILIAQLRSTYVRWTTSTNSEFFNTNLMDLSMIELFQYMVLMILTHHFTLFSIEYFKIDSFLYVLKDTGITSALTLIFISIINSLMLRRKTL